MKGEPVIINKPGHMAKMAAMPIYDKKKIPSKILFAGTFEPIATKLDM